MLSEGGVTDGSAGTGDVIGVEGLSLPAEGIAHVCVGDVGEAGLRLD
jgi:hypothetical protein